MVLSWLHNYEKSCRDTWFNNIYSCHSIFDMLVSLASLRRIIPIAPFLLCCKAVSRAYPKGCSNELPSYYSYDDYELPPRDVPIRTHEEFALLRRLGAGKFSDVFEAVEIKDQSVMDIEFMEELDPKLLCVIKVSDEIQLIFLLTHHVVQK